MEAAAEPLLDTTDLVVLTCVLCAGVYLAITHFLGGGDSANDKLTAKAASRLAVSDDDLLGKLKASGKSMVIFFGSQTGTAEDYASRLVKEAKQYGIKALAADLEDYDMEQLTSLHEIDNVLAVFCLATYGEGDPTDNAQEFWDLLKANEENLGEFDLKGLKYAVFGLGNKTYEHYNTVGTYVDDIMDKFGGSRLLELGLGDDDANLEEDFVTWSDNFWAATCDLLDIDPDSIDLTSQRQYTMKVNPEVKEGYIFKGEPEILGSLETQKRPYTIKNPFMAPIVTRTELYKDGSRSCLHIELDIKGSGIRYTAGDHVAIYPTNEKVIVDRLGKRLGVDLDTICTFVATDEDANKKTPFPCPCSFRTALSYYIDITSLPKTNILRELANHASDDKEKKALTHMATKEGKKDYGTYIIRDQRSLLQVLEEHASVKVPIDLLLELLPRLQPRYYSISSSSKAHPDQIHVTAAVVQYETKLGVEVNGVCTNWLAAMTAGKDAVPIFTRTSTFRLPPRNTTDVVMIGPGTGIAPFRGFIQERDFVKAKGKPVGKMHLYFGCQKRKEHFLYEKELVALEKSGTIDKLYVACSRDQTEKVYVQHLLRQNGKEVYAVLKGGGHFYVCGDAKHMARDVNSTLVQVAVKEGGLTEQQAVNWVKDLRLRKRYAEDVWS